MEREQWSSRAGFILAAAGSAIGLGNIWRFSYVAGDEGGAAFLVLYLITVFLIGYPLLATEIALGRSTRKNPLGAFRDLAPDSPWWLVGAMGVLSGFVIMSFYSVIAGWSFSYVFRALQGFSAGTDFTALFVSATSAPVAPVLWHGAFMAINILIIGTGVVKGIQKVSELLMPLLFLLLAGLVIRSLTLPGAIEGVRFLFVPDFRAVTPGTLLRAVGHSFFTLSLGMGALVTYGSYLDREARIPASSAWIVGLDTLVALLAGLAIFPAVFALGFAPGEGVGLAFMTLPAVFSTMPGGHLASVMFFLLLTIAALTSSISMLEVVVAWITDEKGWPRRRASLIMGGIIFLAGLPPVLGFSHWSHITIAGLGILDFYDFLASDIMLPLGGLLTALFAVHVWKHQNTLEEINRGTGRLRFGSWYRILAGYLIPAAVTVVMIYGVWNRFLAR